MEFVRYGDTPYIKRGFQVDPKRLFYSDYGLALKKMVTLAPGYGILEAGTLIGKITESTGRKDMYAPYAVLAPVRGLPFIAGAYLLEDGGATDTTAKVTIKDSYKFAVGDHIAGVDSDATPIDIGAITSIDRTTYSHYALIGFAQVNLSSLTVANGGILFIQTKTASPYTKAYAILGEGVDTGEGVDAAGGQGAAVFSHAIVYKGLLPNSDAGALTDLGAVEDGQHLILK
jgi:hypothetical protein